VAFPFVALPKVPALCERLREEFGCSTFPMPLSCSDGRQRTATVVVREKDGRTLRTVIHDRGGCLVPSALEKVLLDLEVPLAAFGLDPTSPTTPPAVFN
jgi:hypothetical protein